MSVNQTVPVQFRQEFIDGMIYKFQTTGFMLKGFTKAPSKVTADKVQWDVLGNIVPSRKQRGSDAALANPTHTKVETSLEEWESYFIIDEYDLMRMPHNLKEDYKTKAAMGLGERFDANILIEMNVGAQSAVGAQEAGDGVTPVGLDKIVEQLGKARDVRKWPMNITPVVAVTNQTMTSFLKYPQFTNSQYVGPDLPFRDMPIQARTWNGAHYVALPLDFFPSNAANTHDFFAWVPDSVGYASNFDGIQDMWGQLVRRRAWECNMMISGKAKSLLPEGILRFRQPNTVPLTF